MFGFLRGSSQPKKPAFSVQPRQEVEVEFEVGNGVYEAYFVQVQEKHSSKLVLQTPGTSGKQLRVGDGQSVTLSVLCNDAIFSCNTSVLSARDREFDIKFTKKDESAMDVTSFPPRDDDFSIQVSIPVEFRAMSTAHTQVAKTHSVTQNGIFLQTNLPIPKATSLIMEVEIPNGTEINTKGKALSSTEDNSSGRRQYITEIEFDADISEKDRNALVRYAMFLKQRQERAEKRLADG